MIAKLVSKPSGNTFVFGAAYQRFKSRTGHIRHSVAKDLPPLQHLFKRNCVDIKKKFSNIRKVSSLMMVNTSDAVVQPVLKL